MQKTPKRSTSGVAKVPADKMDAELCGHFLTYLLRDSDMGVGAPNRKVRGWLNRQKLPRELSNFAQKLWPQRSCVWGSVSLNSLTDIMEDEIAARLAPFKFFCAGYSITGDAFVLDISTGACAPGFIPICEWDAWADQPPDPHPFFESIARTFDSFLFRVVENLFLPVDYYVAKRLNQFKAAELASAARFDQLRGKSNL